MTDIRLKDVFDVEQMTTEQLLSLQTMSVLCEKYSRHLLNGTEKEWRIKALDGAAWSYYNFWCVVTDEIQKRYAEED